MSEGEPTFAEQRPTSLFHQPMDLTVSVLLDRRMSSEAATVMVAARLAWLFDLRGVLSSAEPAPRVREALAEIEAAIDDVRVTYVWRLDLEREDREAERAPDRTFRALIAAMNGSGGAPSRAPVDPRALAAARSKVLEANERVLEVAPSLASPGLRFADACRLYAQLLGMLLSLRRDELRGDPDEALVAGIDRVLTALDEAWQARAPHERDAFERLGTHPVATTAEDVLALLDPQHGEPDRGPCQYEHIMRNALSHLRAEDVAAADAAVILGGALGYASSLRVALLSTTPGRRTPAERRLERWATAQLDSMLARVVQTYVQRLARDEGRLVDVTAELLAPLGGEAAHAPAELGPLPITAEADAARVVGATFGALVHLRQRMAALPPERLSASRRALRERALAEADPALDAILVAWASRVRQAHVERGKGGTPRTAYQILGLVEELDKARRAPRPKKRRRR